MRWSTLRKLYFGPIETHFVDPADGPGGQQAPKRSLNWRSWGRQALVSSLLTFMLMDSVVTLYWDAQCRLLFRWQRVDSLGIVLALGIAALVLMIGWHVLGRFGKHGRYARRLLFVLVCLRAATINIYSCAASVDLGSHGLAVVLKIVAGLLVIGFFIRPDPVFRFLRASCLIFSPILLFYVLTLAMADTCPTAEVYQSATPGSRSESVLAHDAVDRVIVVVFDEWSYQRTFDGDEVRSSLPEISRIADHSLVFSQAHSPADATFNSMPSLCLGLAGGSKVAGNVHYFTAAGKTAPVRDMPSIFSDMRSRGYSVELHGNYIPYRHSFGDVFDVCVSRNSERIVGPSVVDFALMLLYITVDKRVGTYIPIFKYPSRYYRQLHPSVIIKDLHRRTIKRLGEPGPYFLLVHQPLPHPPLTFDREGAIPYIRYDLDSDKDYDGNMQYVDRLAGELYDAAMAEPSQKTLIIFTADHSYRTDPNLSLAELEVNSPALRHIPLIVALTGEKKQTKVEFPFNTKDLREVLGEFLDEPTDLATFAERCRKHEGDL